MRSVAFALSGVAMIRGHLFDEEPASLLAVHTSNSKLEEIDSTDNDPTHKDIFGERDPACAVEASEGFVIHLGKQGDSNGDVKAELSEACHSTADDWGYSADLCNEVMDELFTGADADAPFDVSNCAQVEGLVREHWLHQLARRAQPPKDVELLESNLERGTIKKHTCLFWRDSAQKSGRNYHYTWVQDRGSCMRCRGNGNCEDMSKYHPNGCQGGPTRCG